MMKQKRLYQSPTFNYQEMLVSEDVLTVSIGGSSIKVDGYDFGAGVWW